MVCILRANPVKILKIIKLKDFLIMSKNMPKNMKTYMLNNPAARIAANLRSRMRKLLKGKVKSAKALELLGCSAEEWKVHLEQQFSDGMNWDNYGDWEIDHIKPCASFNLELEEEQKACFHYSNTQPLWQPDNASKGCKF